MNAEPASEKDIAVLTFRHMDGAERAYADVRDADPAAPWLREVVFVEGHHKGALAVRGTFAGRYVDVSDVSDAIGPDTAGGMLVGSIIGWVLGPPAFAVGTVTGGMVGGHAQAHHGIGQRGRVFDQLRQDVPEGASALVVYAPAADVDAMIAAFGDRPEAVERHTPSPDETRQLEEAVRTAPRAAP